MRAPRTLGLVVVGASLVLAAGLHWWPSDAVGAGETAGVATTEARALPPFAFTALDGQTVTPDSVKGNVLLVNFWATWCAPCRQEFPSLVALQARHGSALQVLGMAFDEGPLNDINAFARQFQTNFPIIVAHAAEAELFGGIIGLPATFIVDRAGHIVYTHVGYASADMLEDAVQNVLRDRGL